MNDIFVEIMLEYIQNKYHCYEQDYERVKERIQLCIQLYSLEPESLQDFVICKTRLDTASDIFRTINELLLVYSKNNKK